MPRNPQGLFRHAPPFAFCGESCRNHDVSLSRQPDSGSVTYHFQAHSNVRDFYFCMTRKLQFSLLQTRSHVLQPVALALVPAQAFHLGWRKERSELTVLWERRSNSRSLTDDGQRLGTQSNPTSNVFASCV
ncbi:hypothetical protein, unlikely [Trypanosoma congolense IL3000]|uniref:Uncharacterized protein n=1 Tax=Trypanosoma congolense (strain IL3000) TaxID=1068625 RepID=F9WAA4_TRYCI|nr:hypothetical protein, unlikely [Trypanosoma congolense IL3000]